MNIKLVNFISYLTYIKGFQDTPEQSASIQSLIDTIQNGNSLKIITTDPETQDEEEWQGSLD